MVLMEENMEGYLTVRLESGDQGSTISSLDREWTSITTAYPFVSYFLDDGLLEMYQPIREGGRIFLVMSIAAILFSCLGLYSLLEYSFCQQKFETGVRKILGASNLQIMIRQFREVFVLILLASLLAWTGVYLLAKTWLEGMHDHIGINPLNFLISTLILIAIVMAISAWQTWVAAITGPEFALKYE
jgi:putative ABC transport system permease protein